MNVTISQSALNKSISIVSKALSSGSAVPMLSGVLLTASDGVLELQTTNLEQSIRVRVAANVEEPGGTVVPGKVFANVVKSLPDEAVTIDAGGSGATVKCGRSRFRLNTMAAKDFPEFPKATPDATATIQSALLAEMVDRTYKMVSKDKSRPILGCVKLDVDGGMVRLAATDSYRLAVCDAGVDFDGTLTALVPGNAFHDVMGMASGIEDMAISTTSNQVIFEFGTVTYVTRALEGNFPDYRKLLPSSFTTSVRIDHDLFAAALKRVSVMATSNPSVRFDVVGDVLTMSASTPEDGDSSEQLDVDTDGNDLAIALNGKFVSEAIAACDDDVSIEMNGPMAPAVFKSYGTINYLCLCMPVKLA